MKSEIKKIIKKFKGNKSALISILQDVQKKYGYLPKEAISMLAEELKISENEIYGVATFYSQFRFNKPGKYQLKACQGTACHVRGGKRIMGEIERELKITHGETTENGLFSLERVACMGCCALAPVIVENDKVYGTCTPVKVREVINKSKAEG
ncbi:MAG: NADH-quinone oxidoreductase subunit NuoE [Thermoplasmatales archaeon]|nr:NADH-quinone oxidoreductase subunit NuoE [Thermoplasmatales archaeon]